MVEVHERAHRALGIRQRRAQPLALVRRQALHHLLNDARRQVGRDIGQLVGLERLRGGHQLGRVHRLDERFAHRVADLQQDLAVAIRLDQVPDRQALIERQRLEDVGDVGRVQPVQASAQRARRRALPEQRLHLRQVLLQVLDLEAILHQGICAADMRARMVPTRPSMYAVVRPRS
jgi:hypothetical protein